MNHTEAFDELLAEQPADWAFFEVYVTLDDPLRLNEARVSLARANARPSARADHDFEITVANTHGHGAARRASCARRCASSTTAPSPAAPGPAPPARWCGRRRPTATAPSAGARRWACTGDEDDLQLLAELAGVLDQTVTDAGLSQGPYLVLRELVAHPGPNQVTDLAARLGGEPGRGRRRSAGGSSRPGWRRRGPTASRPPSRASSRPRPSRRAPTRRCATT